MIFNVRHWSAVDRNLISIALKRFFLSVGAYLMNTVFVLACWLMGHFSTQIVMCYLVLMASINLTFFFYIRSGLNKRFADPTATTLQMMAASLVILFLMYFAGDARSTFLLLVVTILQFGLFHFKTRDFLYLSVFVLGGYGVLIALLLQKQSGAVTLSVEILQWMALFVTLMQFSVLAGNIALLRRKVRENNKILAERNAELDERNAELDERNAELEVALQRISDMAIRDALTGVYNRRYLTERIEEEVHRNTRHGSTFCICMIDIDCFKKINDNYGHQAGDVVLCNVAKVASGSLRKTDFFGRFGGEEFVMVLTETPIEGAIITAERLRQRIENLSYPEIDPTLKVTISIGIAEHVRKTEAAATFKKADDALYRAKENGRNACMPA
jgi:diguanylate cyclase (GGDEF)-like protein